MKVREGVLVVVSPPAAPWDVDCSSDEPLTKQEFVKDCDVNLIIARCLKGMGLTHINEVRPVFADVSQIGDFADCVRRVDAAYDAFMLLPAEVRSEFQNDPVQLVRFLQDPGNRGRAIELGLIEKPKESEPVPVGSPVVSSGGDAAVAAPAAGVSK